MGLQTCADLQPLHSRCLNSEETEIISGITPAPKAYLRKIGMKKALCSLIGSVGCCNPGTEQVLIFPEQTAQFDIHLSCLSERKDTAEKSMMSQKTGLLHKPTSLWFLHDCDQLHLCINTLLLKMLETNTSSFEFPCTAM